MLEASRTRYPAGIRVNRVIVLDERHQESVPTQTIPPLDYRDSSGPTETPEAFFPAVERQSPNRTADRTSQHGLLTFESCKVSLQIDFNTHWSSESKHRPHFVSDETEAGVCAVGAYDHAISAPAHPERWSLPHHRIAQAPWLLRRLPVRVPRRACS